MSAQLRPCLKPFDMARCFVLLDAAKIHCRNDFPYTDKECIGSEVGKCHQETFATVSNGVWVSNTVLMVYEMSLEMASPASVVRC